jgi:hypothetical protein
MRTVYMVYQDSNPNDVVALFFSLAKAQAYQIAVPVPATDIVEAQIPVPFNRVQLIPVNPL